MSNDRQAVNTCGLCGDSARDLVFQEGEFSILRCTNCGLVYVSPRLSPAALLTEVYNENYWASDQPKEKGYADYAAEETFYLRTFRRRINFLHRFCQPPGRLLDVGCAAGYFLTVAGEQGWEGTGVEPSAAIAAVARQRLPGLSIHGGGIEDADLAPASFDVVTLWDVVEHTSDPVDFIKRAVALVKPGGTLLLETQNVESRFARLLGPKWQHFKHHEHLFHFSPTTLKRLLGTEAGLEILGMTSRFGGKYVSPAFIAERAGRVHPLLSKLLKPCSLLKKLGIYINLYDELIVACRRPVGPAKD